ncbi:MAG TPA: nucleotidyltransferase family protein, partial [Chitinolyticbacter sp.]|nr:nucleotidyltransferase family protein [Chitinolyticbacter sp.]
MRAQALPDGWIVAGFLRNLIWDHRFGTRTGLNDVDVVYFDALDLGRARERQIEVLLAATVPQVCWQVRNQARMHLRHGHAPYRDCLDAVSRYPEC